MSKFAGTIAFAVGLVASVIIITHGMKAGQYVIATCGFVTLIVLLVMIIVIADVGIATTGEDDNENLFTEIDIETTQGMDT